MKFSHDFADDLEQLDFFSPEPWALVRFADGERAIFDPGYADCPRALRFHAADGWDWRTREPFALAMRSAFCEGDDDYYIGISCPCCDRDDANWYRHFLKDSPRLTFSNLFCNANYDRFRQRCMQEKFGARCAIVGSAAACHYDIPRNLVNHPEAMKIIDETVAKLKDEHRTILVAAGPASNIIIHRYWTTCPAEKRRVICDIGSALDPWLHGRFTRGYHDPSHPNRKKVCVWTTTK